MKPIDAAKILVALLAGVVVAADAGAQTGGSASNFPSKSIRIIVPFPPPGPADVVARSIAQKMTASLGQPVVVENRAGATGAIGSEFVAKAPPDGYTLLVGSGSTHAVAPAINPKLPYDNLKDFAPITLLTTSANVLTVHPSVPAKTIVELIALLKANPGKYNVSSTGVGSFPHLAGEMFQQMSGTIMTHVPYQGTGPALNAIIAGHVQVAFESIIGISHIHAGRMRALGVTGPQRSPTLPDIPAIAEVLPGYEAMTWLGLFAPTGTPPDITARLEAAARAAMQPELTRKWAELGMTSVGNSRGEFAAFVRKDTERWRGVAKAMNLVMN